MSDRRCCFEAISGFSLLCAQIQQHYSLIPVNIGRSARHHMDACEADS
jgi:hypothetical protein